jgi:hypothetical protein
MGKGKAVNNPTMRQKKQRREKRKPNCESERMEKGQV